MKKIILIAMITSLFESNNVLAILTTSHSHSQSQDLHNKIVRSKEISANVITAGKKLLSDNASEVVKTTEAGKSIYNSGIDKSFLNHLSKVKDYISNIKISDNKDTETKADVEGFKNLIDGLITASVNISKGTSSGQSLINSFKGMISNLKSTDEALYKFFIKKEGRKNMTKDVGAQLFFAERALLPLTEKVLAFAK